MPPCSTSGLMEDRNKDGVQESGEITQQMVQDLDSDNLLARMEALVQIRKMASRSTSPPAKELIQKVPLHKFVDFMKDEQNWQLQVEAAWVLCNIAAGISFHTRAVVQAGAVPALIPLLDSIYREVRDTAIWALGNIAADSPSYRNLVLSQKVLTTMLQMMDQQNSDSLRTWVWVVRILLRTDYSPIIFNEVVPILPVLSRLVFHGDDEVSDEACRALTNLGERHSHQLRNALGADFCRRLRLLHKAYPERFRIASAANSLCYTKQASEKEKNMQDPSLENKSVPVTPATQSSGRMVQSPGKKRFRSPSPGGVSTRNTPKRYRSLSQDVSPKASEKQRIVKTRAKTRKLMNRAPNHSTSYIFKKKVELFQAVEEGNLEKVEDMVQMTGPAITRNKTGCTLLHTAAANNQSDVVLFLLQLISPNIVNKEGQTPAHLAAMKGHTRVLRILLADEELNHDKQDNSHRTYKDWLSAPLFKAVLEEDINKIAMLLKLGADPDYYAGSLVDGVLSRELQVTTSRQLALSSHRQSIVNMFKETKSENITAVATKIDCNSHGWSIGLPNYCIPIESLGLMVTPRPLLISGPDVYKMDTDPRGYVCVLNYSSFKDRPDLHLEGSQSDTRNLASIFSKMGFTGHSHSSLTADQTKQVLMSLRDMEMLDHVGCGIFIISSHGIANEEFLTSDMKHLTTQWVCDLFKDCHCPQLKNKPKLFIFNFCNEYYKGHSPLNSMRAKCKRVTEPLRDTVCLYSGNGSFSSYSFTKDGTPFIRTLCDTLAQHAHNMELGDLYREFISEYSKTSPSVVPVLHNIGFTKKFYFNPTSLTRTMSSPLFTESFN